MRQASSSIRAPHDTFTTDDEPITEINGSDIPPEDEELVRRWVIEDVPGIHACPYCRTALNSAAKEDGYFNGGGSYTKLLNGGRP